MQGYHLSRLSSVLQPSIVQPIDVQSMAQDEVNEAPVDETLNEDEKGPEDQALLVDVASKKVRRLRKQLNEEMCGKLWICYFHSIA